MSRPVSLSVRSARLLAAAASGLAMAPLAARAIPALDRLSPLLPAALLPAAAAVLAARRRGEIWLAALATTGAVAVQLDGAFAAAPPAGQGRRLVVVSHNLAVRNADPARTARVLLESGADVLLLQEADGAAAGVLDRLRVRYPHGSRCPRPCSLAILSRWPTSRIRYRFRDRDDRAHGPALIQGLTMPPGLPPVPVVSLHLSRHRSDAEAAAGRAALVAAVARADGAAMVLGGDFNLVPWSAALRGLDAGLRPLARVTRAVFSYPARPVPLVPIDQIYAGPRWVAVRVTRLERTGSDHYPLRAELVWQR